MKQPSFIFLLLLLFLILTGCAESTRQAPLAANGYLDLSNRTFNENEIVHLDGEWILYRQRLLPPEHFSGPNQALPDGIVTVPGHWPKEYATGYLTCRLRIRLKPGHTDLAIRVGEVLFAYKLWVNGRLAASAGKIGTTRETEEPANAIRYIRIDETAEFLDLILQISNFSNKTGGVTDSILIGNETVLRTKDRLSFSYLLLVSGGLLLMGVYHFLLYLIRSDERATLYLSLLCLLAGIHHGCDWFLLDFVPLFPKPALYRIDRISFYISVLMIILYINAFFPEEASELSYPVYIVSAAISSLVVLFTPGFFYSHLEVPYQFLAFCGIFYLAWVLIKAIRNNREGSLWLLCGFCILGLTGINDILYVHGLIQTGYLYAVGVLILVLSQAFVLAIRFFNAFQTVENLSLKLETKNIELSRMDKVKDEFLANTSHELRTPLNGIIGIAESIKDGAFGTLSDKIKNNLALITASGRRLAGLVNDILDFSRLKNSDILLQKEPVDLRKTADIVLAVTAPLVTAKNLTMVNRISDKIPGVTGDSMRLQQVLYNLVGNAIKFTPEGEIRISAEKQGEMVAVSVSDSGIGISEEHLSTIFQSFEQVEGTGARHYEGVGLGLPITKHLVELHGGTISVESIVAKGTTFTFTMPVTEEKAIAEQSIMITAPHAADSDLQLQVPDKIHEVKPPKEVQQILVVDDDPVNLQVVVNQLSFMENINIHTRMSGPGAISFIRENGPPDLILLDIMMPGMTGYEVCRTLRETHSASELPVIFLTAKNRLEDLAEGFACGANDYLSKPFTKEELTARVSIQLHLKQSWETFLENQRLEQEVTAQTLEKEKAKLKEEKAMIEMLRYQLNPHFLFNSLTSIRGAVLGDRDTAHQMISHLADFCRLALSCGNMETLTVAQEFEIIRHYLSMERMRFGDYLTISIEIDPEAENLHIPSFIIQPLVENAIKYGSRTSQDALDIRMVVETHTPDTLSLKISNTGAWVMPDTTDKKESTGTGIANVRQRLETYYAEKYTCEKHVRDGRVTFEIILPRLIPGKHHRIN